MSRDQDLDLDAILAEFHGQEAAAKPVKRPASSRTPSRRELREAAERQAAAERPSPSEEKTVLFEALPQEKEAAQQSAAAKSPGPAVKKQPAEAEKQREISNAPSRERAEKSTKAPVRTRKQAKKEQKPGVAFALMFLVLVLLAAALAGLMHWSRLAEEAAQPQPPEEIRMSLGENLEALLDEEAASSR